MLFVNDYCYDSCKSDVVLFVMVIELPRTENKAGYYLLFYCFLCVLLAQLKERENEK